MARLRVRLLFLFACITCAALSGAAEIKLPGDDAAPGWTRSGPVRRFAGSALFNYINGGAELFYEFGFETLWVQTYENAGREITLEVYLMNSPESAWGVYLYKKGRETPVPGIRARNTGGAFQVLAMKGSSFLAVQNPEGDESALPAMVVLINCFFDTVPDEETDPLLNDLPEAGIISGSEILVRGPYALEPVYTFGKGDVFRLGGKVYGVVADYTDSSGERYTRIFIPYPDEKTAAAVFDALLANMDASLLILDSNDTGCVFRDYQGKFGFIKVQRNRLAASVNLKDRPDF